jgi:hypothetical protein
VAIARCPYGTPGAQLRDGRNGVWSGAPEPLRALTGAENVKSKSEHGLRPFWRSDEILAAIDAFADRAGRRGPS